MLLIVMLGYLASAANSHMDGLGQLEIVRGGGTLPARLTPGPPHGDSIVRFENELRPSILLTKLAARRGFTPRTPSSRSKRQPTRSPTSLREH